jgi:TPR repeat protein
MSAEDDRLYLQMAAEKGDAKAQSLLGRWYFSGQGGTKDYAKAAVWYEKAAEQGNVDAQLKLGLLYYTGQGVSEDVTKAVKWFGKAAEQGNARSQFYMGITSEDKAKAAEWFSKAAEQGDADAQYELGFLYFNGQGVPKDDIKAIQWLDEAEMQGNEKAKELSDRLLSETLVDNLEIYVVAVKKAFKTGNYANAIKLLGRSAEKGDAEAQVLLGSAYNDGKGVPKDPSKAYELFSKAAAQGHEDAKDFIAKKEAEEKRKQLQEQEREERERKEREHQQWLASEEGQKWQAEEKRKAEESEKAIALKAKKEAIKIKIRNTIIRCIIGLLVGLFFFNVIGIRYINHSIVIVICVIISYISGISKSFGKNIFIGTIIGIVSFTLAFLIPHSYINWAFPFLGAFVGLVLGIIGGILRDKK